MLRIATTVAMTTRSKGDNDKDGDKDDDGDEGPLEKGSQHVGVW